MAESVSSGTMAYPDGFHIFAELMSTESLTAPIKASGRIKYTCIAVSRHYIGLGASSGSLYIFHRNTFRYLQVFSNSEGALTRVAFAPDDNLVGIATSRGTVVVWELNIERRERSERLAVSSAHRNGHVTGMIWDSTSERLFTGDDHGRITLLNVFHRKMSGLFKLPTELVMDADSSIVQLDFCDDKLLASTMTKCFICDTKKKQAYAVGTRLRDGKFGACFLQKATKEFPLIYSARPGSRMWEVNIVGQVQATHQFKHLLAIPSLPIVGPGRNPILPDAEHQQKHQSFNFAQLLKFGHGNNLLLTWTTQAIYVFDPARIKVLVWSNDFKDIFGVCVFKSRIYCLHPNSQVKCYTMLSAERCVSKLFALSLWEQCAQTAIHFAERIKQGSARRYVPRSLIQEVNYQLMDGSAGFRMIGQLEELLSNMEDDGLSTPGSSRRSSLDSFEGIRLDSGIYLVRNRAGSDDSVDDVPVRNAHPTVVDREIQMESLGGFQTKLEEAFTSKVDKTEAANPNEDIEAKLQDEVTEGTTSAKSEEELTEIATGFDVEEDEDIDDPGELMQGPAGINWGFGHGRIAIRRESSLLEEIAETPEIDQKNKHALVKDGELDTNIAESLNSGVEPTEDSQTSTQSSHHADQTDNQNDNQQAESSSTKQPSANSNHGNEQNQDPEDQVNLDDAMLPSLDRNYRKPSLESNQPFHSCPGIGNELESQQDQLRIGPNQESSAQSPDGTRWQDSQTGSGIPNQASLASSCPKVPSVMMNESLLEELSSNSTLADLPQTHILQERSTKNHDAGTYKLRSLSVEPTDDTFLPVMRRTFSLPTTDPIALYSGAPKERQQPPTSKDKKRTQKTRIIDFDNPKESKTNLTAKDTRLVPPPPKDAVQLPTKSSTSTTTKRSKSFSTIHPTRSPPNLTPSSQIPLSLEAPPSTKMDVPKSNNDSIGAGPFDCSDELIWGASPMMYGMSGPRMAAHFLAPSLFAMKETLSSKLVKTKEFLKQMSEPDVGSVPVEIPVTVVKEPAAHPLARAPSPLPSAPSKIKTDFPLTESENVPGSEIVDKRDKMSYCQELRDDVIRRLAVATWEAEHELQDPKLSMNVTDCQRILESWLGELQHALSTKNHLSRTESDKESLKDCTEIKIVVIEETTSLVSDSTARGNSSEPVWGCRVTDPFGLPEYISKDLSDLAMLCFEMSVFETSHGHSINQSDRSSDEKSKSCHEESSPPESDQSNASLHTEPSTDPLPISTPPRLTGHSNEQPTSDPLSNFSEDAPRKNRLEMFHQGCVAMAVDASLLEQDKRAASFVKSFFFLLDVDRMRDILKWRTSCRRLTMGAILDCLEAHKKKTATLSDDIDDLVSTMKLQAQKGKAIEICHINRLLQRGKCEMALDFMLEAFPGLSPWEAMLLTDSVTVPSCCFLDYVVGLLDSVEAIDRGIVLASICSDIEVKCHLLTTALTQGAPTTAELFCSCAQMPMPGAHKRVWQNGVLADQILSLPVANHKELLDVCRKHGYWRGVLQLCLDLQDREFALKISLQLGDLQLLGREGFDVTDVDEWVLLLNLMSKLHPNSQTIQCLSCQATILSKQDGDWLIPLATTLCSSKDTSDWAECDDRSSKPECDWLMDSHGASLDVTKLPSDWLPSVTWENVGRLLVKSVGPGLAARMLTDTCIPSGALKRDFFRNCLLVSIIERQERNVCLNFLEGLDTYLWSQRNNALPPTLYYGIQRESGLAVNRETTDTQKPGLKVLNSSDISQNSLYFLEEPDCHWGTNVRLNGECVICALPLTSSVSMETTGRLAFSCGHVFHSACVSEKVCVVCYVQNYRPMYRM